MLATLHDYVPFMMPCADVSLSLRHNWQIIHGSFCLFWL